MVSPVLFLSNSLHSPHAIVSNSLASWRNDPRILGTSNRSFISSEHRTNRTHRTFRSRHVSFSSSQVEAERMWTSGLLSIGRRFNERRIDSCDRFIPQIHLQTLSPRNRTHLSSRSQQTQAQTSQVRIGNEKLVSTNDSRTVDRPETSDAGCESCRRILRTRHRSFDQRCSLPSMHLCRRYSRSFRFHSPKFRRR